MIITIGREYGSGGREIGEKIAGLLGVPFYDKEILTKAAEVSGLSEEFMENHEEKAGFGQFLTGLGVGNMSLSLDMPVNQRVFLAQFDAINRLAEEGPCVIVGRCADYVLRDRKDVLHLFFYASEEKRIERIMRVENCTAEKARELIRKTDKARRNYYNFFANGNWGKRENYDLMLRTDSYTADEIAASVVHLAKR